MESPATAGEADDSCRATAASRSSIVNVPASSVLLTVTSQYPWQNTVVAAAATARACGDERVPHDPRPSRCVMTGVWALAALWLGLALVASLLSIWFRISTALSEIVVGTIAQLIIGAVIGQAVLGTDESWIKFLSGIGAIVLTFLAGAELDPAVFRLKWKEAAAVGLASFFCPFVGCAT